MKKTSASFSAHVQSQFSMDKAMQKNLKKDLISHFHVTHAPALGFAETITETFYSFFAPPMTFTKVIAYITATAVA